MLPKDWDIVDLEKCAEILMGFAFPSDRYIEPTPSSIRLLRGDNIVPGSLRWEGVKYFPNQYGENLKRYEMREGDIVIALDRPIVGAGLKCSVVKADDLPCLLVQRVARLRAKSTIDQRYLSQTVQTGRFVNHLLNKKTESAVPHVSPNDIRRYTIPLPIVSEQCRIADMLLTWDKAIAATKKLLVNSRKQKKALMQQLLTGKRRLPGFTAAWCHYRLGLLFQERVETNRGDLPLLSITREEGVIHRGGVGRKDTSNEDKSKYLRICPGDLGYNTMRMWQGVSALSSHEGIISPAYTVLVPSRLIDGRFAAYLFKFEPVVFLFYRYSQGLVSDTWNLKYQHFAEIHVTIPEREEQEAISAVLMTADEKIGLLERKLAKLTGEKRALMQQLLTGKRRVKLDAPVAEASTA